MSIGEYVFVPIEALAEDDTAVKTYRVLRNHYWAYKPGEGVAFYRLTPRSRYVSPQCNPNLAITEKIIRNVGPTGTEPLLIEQAFILMDSGGTLLPTLPGGEC